MKAIKTIIIAIASMSLFSSCEKLKELINYDVPLTMDYDLEIPASSITEEINIDPISVYANINKEIEDYTKEIGVGKINSVKLTSVTIAIPETAQDETDNLTSISKLMIQFNSDQKSDWASLVNLTTMPTEKFEVSLPIDTNLDFKDYFDSNNYNFKASLGLARATSKPIKTVIKVTVNINVSL